MAAFVRDGEPLSVRVMKGIDSDDRGTTFYVYHAGEFAVQRRKNHSRAQAFRYALYGNRGPVDAVFLKESFRFFNYSVSSFRVHPFSFFIVRNSVYFEFREIR